MAGLLMPLTALALGLLGPGTAENLIPNGDFTQGNAGFKSDLPYTAPADNCLWPASYTIAKLFNDPQLHSLIVHEAFMAPRRPTGHEQVMFANAGGPGDLKVWEMSVECKPKTTYKLSFFSVCFSGVQDEGTPPRQIFTPEWVPTFAMHVNNDVSPDYSAGMGKYFKANMTWYSGNNKSAKVTIVRNKMDHNCGIIGIANIEMVAVKPATTTSETAADQD